MLPLLLVAFYGNDEWQRQRAVGMFMRWRTTGTVAGLCTLALQKVNDNNLD
jgi:hypothetical protein